MKFDLIISNPPYNKGLDLKILKEVYPLCEKIVMVHPATWLYDNKLKNKLFKGTRELVKDHFVCYEKVEDANRLFGIALFTDVFITHIDKNKKGLGDKIYDIDIHGDSKTYKSLKKKVLDYCKEGKNLDEIVCKTWKDKFNPENYEVGFSMIRGNTNQPDFHTFIQLTNETKHLGKDKFNPENYEVGFSMISPGGALAFMGKTTCETKHVGKGTDYTMKFAFKTENEAIKFKDYLKLKLTRFCLSIFKINQNLGRGELASVPYMPTYTKSWTDADVAVELGLTNEELKFALDWVPNYYPEDTTKYN